MTIILPQSAGLKYLLVLAISLVLYIFPTSVFAEKAITEEWKISADKITRYDNPESIIAEGNIQLIKLQKLPPKPPEQSENYANWSLLLEEKPSVVEKKSQNLVVKGEPRIETKVTIKADWMAYDVTLGTIKAKGHVDIVTDDDHVVAEQAVVNLTRDTGTFTNATITRRQNELHLEGKTVEKTGVLTYHIVDGWVITCKVAEGETPPWSFSSNDTTITQGGYAFMKNATFDIKGVPVFYTPYMVFPAKNTRETGFLYPEFSVSQNSGYGFNIPFFYNISDSADMTIFSEYYSKRGLMPGLEFRYILDRYNKGTFAANFLHDNLTDPSETKYYQSTGFTHTDKDRYWIRGKVDNTIGDGWESRLDLDIVSDRDYLTEFNSSGYTGFQKNNDRFVDIFGRGFQDKTDDQRQNSLNILRKWTGMSFVTDFLAINDVRPTTSSPTPLWRLPGLDFTGAMPIYEDSDFNIKWDANYVNYWRKDGIGGQRIDVHPQISTPIPLSPYLESRAELGVRETLYGVQTYGDGAWSQGDNPNRAIYDFHTELGTTLARDFAIPIDDNKGITHKLRPFVMYDYIPEKDQTKLPQFDGIDLINPANTVTYGVDNFFNLFKEAKGSNLQSKRDYISFKVKQSYYLDDVRKNILFDSNNNILPTDETDKPLSPINMKLGWKPQEHTEFKYKTDLDVYGHGFINHTIESSYQNEAGDILDIDYRYGKYLDVHQINVHARTMLLSNVRGEILVSRSLTQSETNEEDISLVYLAPCWSVEIRSIYTPTDKGLMLIFNLANIGSKLGMAL